MASTTQAESWVLEREGTLILWLTGGRVGKDVSRHVLWISTGGKWESLYLMATTHR